MEIAKADILAHTIRKLIDEKQNMLFDSTGALAKKREKNHYLGDVVDDYNVYLMNVVQEKVNQINALQKLSKYTDEINKTNCKTRGLLWEIKADQHSIHGKLNKLHEELQSLKRKSISHQ
jgi:Txe/YoeB family toxin of Txe-Axe toxin-antitoxin module